MNIILNNQSDEIHDGITIKELLDHKKIHTKYIAVEINQKIIRISSEMVKILELMSRTKSSQVQMGLPKHS